VTAVSAAVRALALLAAASLTGATQVRAVPTEAEREQGRQVYDEFCVPCHGRDMVTSGAATFDLRKFPKDDFARFRKAVLEGKPPAMPAWRDRLGDEDLELLWAYVRSGG
jgi:mono/diheme cytochrome c family protein